MLRRITTTALAVTAALLVASGCDSAGEQVAEGIAEQAAGEGVDVDVDVDGDDVTIDSEDGTSNFSTSGDLPEGWPDFLELPDGATLAGSTAVETDGGRQMTANGTTDLSPPKLLAHVEDQLDGWNQTAKSNVGSNGSTLLNVSWERDGETANLAVNRADGADETTFVLGVVTKG